MRGFKNFLMRGDVIVVAVGLVVALAFSGLITAFTSDIITEYCRVAAERYANGEDVSRMATIQELADEAFADVLKKHGIPIDLKDALRKSAALPKQTGPAKPAGQTRTKSRGARKAKS